MGFFEVKPPRPLQDEPRRERSDEGWTRPAMVLPRYLETDYVVAANDEVAVVALGIACYPTGFSFFLETVTRYVDDGGDDHDYGDLFWRVRTPQTRWTISAIYRPANTEACAFSSAAAGGGGGSWSYEIWVSPLPPEGPVSFVCEWPAFDSHNTAPPFARSGSGAEFWMVECGPPNAPYA